MAVNLSPALVTGVILLWLVISRSKHGWVALFGVMFGVAIAAGTIGAFVKEGNGTVTKMAGQGVGMVDTQLGGPGVAPVQSGLPSVAAQPPASR